MPKSPEKLSDAYEGATVDGLYFRHTLLGGRIFISVLLIITSLIVSAIWSARKADIGGGFTIGNYILAIVPAIILLFTLKRKE
jgi:hypothetical protein